MNFLGENRVVVTGLGIVAPNGIGVKQFWETLVKGQSGISKISLFDASGLKSRIAGEVKQFNPLQYIDAKHKPHRKARHTQFALAATTLALKDAEIDLKSIELTHPLPIMIGMGSSSFEMIAESGASVAEKGPRHASPFVVTEATPNSVPGSISEFLGVHCQCLTFATACVAGFDAIAEGARRIQNGEADILIAGGTETPISMVPFANFDNAGMCSRQNDAPEKASRPFDGKRDSGVISEGCGILILENLDHALSRGVKPYMEISGYGVYTDPPGSKPGSGFEFSMKMALANAAKRPEEIDYLCAWGPSHPEMDSIETQMIKKVFNQHAYSLAVSSIKGVIGNPLSAAGPLMLASCSLMFKHKLIPPTANYTFEDPDCDLDYVPNVARPFKVNTALLNAHGVGGANSSLVVKRFEPCGP